MFQLSEILSFLADMWEQSRINTSLELSTRASSVIIEMWQVYACHFWFGKIKDQATDTINSGLAFVEISRVFFYDKLEALMFMMKAFKVPGLWE